MNKFLFFTVLLISFSLVAQKREVLLSKERPKADLLLESQKVSLQQEATIQKPPSRDHTMVGILFGTWQPQRLTLTTKTKTTTYSFQEPARMLSARFDTYPLRFYGTWGLSFGPQYSYLENHTPTNTSLHIVGANVGLAYRGELKSTQKLIPYLSYGKTYMAFVQRGLDSFNTSESSELSTMTVALGIHLNRLGLIESRNETELLIQYQKTSDPVSANRDLNGQLIQIGGTLNL